MKRIIAIGFVLLSLLFLLQAGLYWVVLIQRQQQREAVRKRLVEGFHAWELMLIEIPDAVKNDPSRPFREIHSREFEYRGQMYDIVEKQEFDETTWYLVYPDVKETKLKVKLKKLIRDNQKNTDKPLPQKVLEEYYNCYLSSIAYEKLKDPPENLPAFSSEYIFSVIEFLPHPPGHPPKS